ncbi:hypothetical protein LTR53_004106 [Teratosphaeriaceae sp. CCFEE 6253]|nr:hypothetical protein LTR53_004106 [Teratosphaeriaceae sp. CCFEE 6253]
MPDVGNITKAGWLYEGNYNEWEKRMDSILVIKGHCRRIAGIPDYLASFGVSPDGDRRGRDRQRHLLRTIQSQVTPAFWQRIPRGDRSDISRMLAKLKAHARPFRLLELSADLRNRIYKQAIVESEEYWLNEHGTVASSRGESEDCANQHLDSILRVSRNVRCESLPIFVSRVMFCVDVSSLGVGGLVSALRKWTERGLQGAITSLQTLYIAIPSSDGRGRSLSLDNPLRRGLSVTHWGALDAHWQALVTNHVAAIEDTRRLLHLQGEAIIMAITTRPDLWSEQAMRVAVREPELDRKERAIAGSRATAS